MNISIKLMVVVLVALLAINHAVYADWGWESTDDPTPYYYQELGKWYDFGETKVFMVQINNKRYKYIFDSNNKFLSGWVSCALMRLP